VPATTVPDAAAAAPARGRSGAPRRRDAVAGAVAAAVALATGELVAAADTSGVSLVTAVGDEVIDRFAASLKDLAVALFGTNDKVALIVGIVLTSLALGAALGRASRDRPWVGPAGFTAFGLLGGWAFQRAALTSAAVGWVAGVVAAGAGAAALIALLRLASPPSAAARAPAVASPPPGQPTDGVAIPGGLVAAPRSAGAPTVGRPDRRRFLVTAGALGAGAAGAALLSRRVRGPDPAVAAREAITLPRPGEALPVPGEPDFAVDGLSPYVTPTEEFFRIDTALAIPRIDPGRWQLSVTGMVDEPLRLSYDELLALSAVEVPVTLQCVSNEVGGDLVGNAVWQGVPLADLLYRAGVQAGATQVVGRSVDGFTAGFPTELATDGRTALVAYAMNGEPLPTRHGFPARLVVAGLYGYVSATKWLEEIQLARWEDVDGYWIPRGWSKEGPIKVTSRIDVPRRGAELIPGTVAVAGVAWAPDRGIGAVEVSVDDGPWTACTLGDAASDETWVQWHLAWDAPPGEHVLRVRATTLDGEVQTAAVAPPAPDGATGHHARRVRVQPTT
jgi:DMSO/TMAO reductase YedYZ molybdopterin-dependent catalytic subunit